MVFPPTIARWSPRNQKNPSNVLGRRIRRQKGRGEGILIFFPKGGLKFQENLLRFSWPPQTKHKDSKKRGLLKKEQESINYPLLLHPKSTKPDFGSASWRKNTSVLNFSLFSWSFFLGRVALGGYPKKLPLVEKCPTTENTQSSNGLELLSNPASTNLCTTRSGIDIPEQRSNQTLDFPWNTAFGYIGILISWLITLYITI